MHKKWQAVHCPANYQLSVQSIHPAKKMKKNYGNLLKKKDIFTKKIQKCPIFHARSSEKQKKVIIFADVQLSTQNQVWAKTRSPCPQNNKKWLKKLKRMRVDSLKYIQKNCLNLLKQCCQSFNEAYTRSYRALISRNKWTKTFNLFNIKPKKMKTMLVYHIWVHPN